VRDPSVWRGYTTSITMSTALRKLVLNPSGSGFANTVFGDVETFIGGVTRADQAMYLTPRIQGLQLAVSFAPEHSVDRIDPSGIPLENGTGAIYRNVWTVGANYIWTFRNGLVVRAGGGVQWGSPPDPGGFGAAVGSPTGVGGGAGAGTARTVQAGLQLGWRGLTVGGTFNRMQNQRIMGSAGSVSLAAPGFPNTVVADGLVWIAAAVYQYGPYGIGLTYLDARNSDCSTTALALDACGRRDRMTVLALTGSYQLGPGVFWETAVFHARIRGNDWNNGAYVGTAPLAGGAVATTASGVAQSGLQSNRATGVMTGLAIMF
jgi:predicted porin